MLLKLSTTLGAIAAANAVSLPVRQTSPAGTAQVNLASCKRGENTFLASGFIYGWPDNGTSVDTSIPDEFVTGFKFRTGRAGGAQLGPPSQGWAVGGYEGYKGRFDSTLSNYLTTRKYGGDFILLPHDLWGADGGLGGGLYPGDDGDWTEMEKFYDQLIKDLKENDMLEGLVIDLWNEPELDIFWSPPYEQYLDYYVRAHKIVREQLPGTLISGPAGAYSPSVDTAEWNQWMARVAEEDVVPDIYSWHQIGGRAPDETIPDFNTLLDKYGLPQRPIDANEYALPEEQNPANTAWYIAQLERYNIRGLRANWGSGGELHDFMADVLFDDEGTYKPNAEWYVYKYYGEMTGKRAKTTASDDGLFDVFASVDGETVKLVAGTRTVQKPYDISVKGLTSVGLPSKGTVKIRTLRFDWEGKTVDTGGPVDLGVSDFEYSENKLIIPVDPPTNSTGYAFEFM